LCYRVDGEFKGLVLLEAESRAHASVRAELEDLSPGGDCEIYEVGPDEAQSIPGRFIGVALGPEAVAELERVIVESIPKKPSAPSAHDDAQPSHTSRTG
jgi:hypothetical protein